MWKDFNDMGWADFSEMVLALCSDLEWTDFSDLR